MPSLLPFRELTRNGIPAFQVCRAPLTTQGVEMAVGEVVAPDTFNRTRLRQLYEQRCITPVDGPCESRSAETFRVQHEQAQAAVAKLPTDDGVSCLAHGHQDDFPLDLPATPVAEQSAQPGYRPPNKRARPGARS